MIKQIIILVSVLMIIFSCNGNKKNTTNSKPSEVKEEVIDITKRKIMTFNVVKIDGVDKILGKPNFTLDFKTNTIKGNSACNSFGGEIIVNKAQIKLGKIRSTQMYCEDTDAIERAFFTTFSKVDNYKLESDKILFFDKEGNELLVGKEAVN